MDGEGCQEGFLLEFNGVQLITMDVEGVFVWLWLLMVADIVITKSEAVDIH